MKISDCMKHHVISAVETNTVKESIQIMIENHIGTLPILDKDRRMIGLVRARDLVSFIMPGFIELVEDVDFVRDFGVLEREKPQPELLEMPIRQIMADPIYVEGSAGLVRVIALLQEHKLNDLPVVDENMLLVGIASYVDIGLAIMSGWI